MAFVLDDLIQDDINYLTKLLQEDGQRIKTKVDELLYNFDEYIKTSDISFLQNELLKHIQLEENVEPTIPANTVQPKKRVLADITETNVLIPVESVKIKQEKISDVFAVSEVASLTAISAGSGKSSANSTINSNNDLMPAPKKLPPRRKKIKEEVLDMPKRSTRTRKKPVRYTANEQDSSVCDVMIQNPRIPVVDITDESDKKVESVRKETGSESGIANEKQDNDPIRSKRTRTVRKARLKTNELQNEPVTNEQTNTTTDIVDKTRLIPDTNLKIKSVNPNATFEVMLKHEPIKQNNTISSEKNTMNQQDNINTTFEVGPEPVLMDCTVVIEKANFNVTEKNSPTPPKQKKKKEIFSPFQKVSTKAKVEAFEKLHVVSKNSATMNTRGNKQPIEQQKHLTPIASKVPTKVHSTTKINRIIHREDSSGNNSMLSAKSQSALKASQAEFRERIKKKQEKELEALRKREALLLAVTEEKRKKREEKQLKAQQQRELLEKEKLKIMETQKLKDEKHKQALAEREEKQQKQKEEAERKYLLVKKRAEELKHRDQNQNLPVYMKTEAPLLPTDDCYDSDEEDSTRVPPKNIPEWSRDCELRKMQHIMLMIGEKIKNTFFSRQVHTPDLLEIFERIDPRKLKRTSSAVWSKPPRYTFFLESSSIQFSEDDE